MFKKRYAVLGWLTWVVGKQYAKRRLKFHWGASRLSIVGSLRRLRGRTCVQVQSRGSLSGRNRRYRVPWRIRCFSTLS